MALKFVEPHPSPMHICAQNISKDAVNVHKIHTQRTVPLLKCRNSSARSVSIGRFTIFGIFSFSCRPLCQCRFPHGSHLDFVYCNLLSTENQMKPLTIIALISTLVMFSAALFIDKIGTHSHFQGIWPTNILWLSSLLLPFAVVCDAFVHFVKILHYRRITFVFDHRKYSIMATIPFTEPSKPPLFSYYHHLASFIFRITLLHFKVFVTTHTKGVGKTWCLTQLFYKLWPNDIW